MAATWHAEAETHLRLAARRLEVIGVTDAEAARMARVAFRLASKIRTDRLQVTA